VESEGWKGNNEAGGGSAGEEVDYSSSTCLKTAADEEEVGAHEDGLLTAEPVADGAGEQGAHCCRVNISWRTEYTGF